MENDKNDVPTVKTENDEDSVSPYLIIVNNHSESFQSNGNYA